MKKILLTSFTIYSILVLSNQNAYSIGEDYMTTATGSYNWEESKNWLHMTTSGWQPASFSPDYTAGTITVNRPLAIIKDIFGLGGDVIADQVRLNDTLYFSDEAKFTLRDGVGYDMVIGEPVLIDGRITGGGTISAFKNLSYDDQAFFISEGTAVEIVLGRYRTIASLEADFIVKSGTIYFKYFGVGDPMIDFRAPVTIKMNSSLVAMYNCRMNETLIVEQGASLYTHTFFYSYGDILNFGTIQNGISTYLRCPSITNNGIIVGSTIFFDSVTTIISGYGSYKNIQIYFGNYGHCNINFLNELNISSDTYLSTLNLVKSNIDFNNHNVNLVNTNIYIPSINNNFYDPALFKFTQTSSATFTPTLNLCPGYIFNGNIEIVSGVFVYNDNNGYQGGNITIDSGCSLNGYGFILLNDLTNNGLVNTTIVFLGNSVVNNGTFASLITLELDSGLHDIQGTGFISKAIFKNNSSTTLLTNHRFGDISINSSASLNVSNKTISFTSSNPILNKGLFTTTGSTIEYNGSSGGQILSINNINYYNLRINNSEGSGIVPLFSSFAVNDTLSLVSGDLELNGSTIVLSPTGYLVETPGNTIIGSNSEGNITTTRILNSPFSLNVGGLGVILSTSSNLGSTVIRRSQAVQNNLNGSTSIQRHYDITPTINTGLNATLTFKYDDSELNGVPEGSLQLFRSTNSGSTWTYRGGTISTTTNEITLSGIDAFSRWSAGSGYLTSSITVIPQGLYNSTSNRLNRKDTVRAYLRNTSSPFSIVDSAKSIIDSVTFNGSFIFTNAPTGIYYVQTKHRNSLETWSKSGGETYNLGSAFSYDFTTASSQAFGNNMMLADASPVKYAIYTGDVNQDGSIDLTEVIQVYNDANNFVTGYVVTDLNRDNIADLADVLMAYNNSVNFVGVVRP